MNPKREPTLLPFSIDPERDTICSVIRRWADIQPDAPALVEEGRALLNYGVLVAIMDDVRAALHASGLGRSDRVAVVHSGGVDMASLILGVISGASAVPLDPRHTVGEFEAYLRDRKVNALIVERDTSPAAVLAARELRIPVMDTRPKDFGGGTWSGIATLTPRKPARTGLSEADDTALVLATSGTTDQSKIVPRSHRRFLARVAVEEITTELGPNDVGVVMRPLFYAGAFNCVLSALYTGGSIVVMANFEPRQFFKILRSRNVTWYGGGPTFQKVIHAHAIAHPEDAADIRLSQIRVETAALEPEIADGLEHLFSTCVSTSYGSTESGRIAFSCPSIGLRKVGTVGFSVERLGFQGSEVRIRSLNGEFLPVGERGEIVVRGPQVFEGYENNEAANAAAFVDGWFRTGDEGFFDEDGYLTLTGRIKEIINRGGEKVSPAEVDAALLGHPDVKEAATFPLRHPTLGEEVAAAVVQAPGAGLTDQVLTRYLLARLTGFKVPRRFYFVSEIPKSDAGRVQRYKLAETLGVSNDIGTQRARVSDRKATPLEAQLQVIWARALGIPEIGLDDNFLMLGGDSLQAVELFLRIEQVLGRRLPRSVLFEAGTVAEMAKRIEETALSPCLVPIQPKGDKPPFFCVHDGNGEVLNYRHLARLVGKAQPFYGIQCLGLDGESVPFIRIEEMAAYYIQEIKKIQPVGPYYIGGYSFGGRVAYVMAQQLRSADEEVALLALLDTASGHGQRHVSSRSWLTHHRERMRSLPVSEIPTYLWMRASNLAGMIYMGTRIRCFALAWRLLESFGWPVPRFLRRPVPANDMIRRTYQARPYDGNATLFKAERYAWTHADAHDGWRDLIRGKLEIRPISGQHFEIVDPPHVQVLARELADALQRAQATYSEAACPSTKASLNAISG